MLSPLFCCRCCSGSRTAFKRVVFVAALVVKGGGVSFLEAKTVKTFIGLVVDVALPRGNGNDFDDDDAVTRLLLEETEEDAIKHPPPPLLLNEPIKVVEDDPERSGDIIIFFYYITPLSRLMDKFVRHTERKKRQSL